MSSLASQIRHVTIPEVTYHQSLAPTTTSHGNWSDQMFNNTLNSSAFHKDCPGDDQEAQSPVMYYSVFSTFFFIGILGNGLLILIFLRHKTMRTAPNTYIFNLAVADLLTTASCASAPLLQDIGHSLPGFCKVFQAVMESSMGVSSFTLAALSAERYYAIAHPFARKTDSKKFILSIIFVIWFVCLSYVIGKIVRVWQSSCHKCVQMFNPSTFANSYIITDYLAFYLIPLGIITYFYVLMAKELYFSTRSSLLESHSKVPPRHLQVRKKIATAVLVFVAMFALCYFPFTFLSLKFYFNNKQGEVHTWAPFTNMLFCVGCLHNCFNPIVLYFLSESYRGHFNNYLFYFVCRSPVAVKEEHTDCRCQHRIIVEYNCSSCLLQISRTR